MSLYAHSLADQPREKWEPLFSDVCPGLEGRECRDCEMLNPDHGHLNKVAWWAAKFAAELFPSEKDQRAAWNWGYLAGLLHDLGKFAPEWQHYLAGKSDIHSEEISGKIDHATAGAQFAIKNYPILGHILAFAISGHHSGLLDAVSENACLTKRLAKALPDVGEIPISISSRPMPDLPPTLAISLSAESLSSFTRMIFSCLVDADFLATEAFMNPGQKSQRPQLQNSVLEKMAESLDARISEFGPPATEVDRFRAQVCESCYVAANRPPGIFSLNVPTGGGKTLSSLAFALRHAIRHGHRRVIYVIPFTSIIEQNAKVFQEIFAPIQQDNSSPVVLEHHSNLSTDRETTGSRLASENWDAPLIVTTAVQFYESLHAARTSASRKIHNIARSIVILDEAQCLPVDYLKPCLESLQWLTQHYGSSVVVCTATQPAIDRRVDFPIGLEPIHPIIADEVGLAQGLKRVRVVDRGALEDTSLAEEIGQEAQVLAIVNTRKHAQKLYQLLPSSEGNVHLSALMCPAHRREVLGSVRARLNQNLPVRLISTQLIEAGVDVDFPVVYRSLAGIDSIAQAAGRCNRNGRRPEGITHVFRSEHQRSEAFFRETAQIADQILAIHEDALGLDAVEAFFNLYYLGHNPPNAPKWDTKNISGDTRLERGSRDLPMLFQFKEIADKFKLIDNDQIPVVIPYDETARQLVAELRNPAIPLHRSLLHNLQQYVVQIYRPEFTRNLAQFELLRDGQFNHLICPETHYSEEFGLHFDSDNHQPLVC